MADSPHEFHALMQRVREGSPDAARDLLERYGAHILRVVRRRLHRKLRSKFDSADFVQAVWASFFTGAPRQHAFDRPEALVAFLATLAQNKVIEAVRQRLESQKYDVARERPLDEPTADRVAARQPTPSQVAVANEEWHRLLADLPAQYQRILGLLREGHTRREVADELGVNERTIRRVIDRLGAEPAA